MRMHILSLFLTLVLAGRALADSVESSTSGGSGTISEDLIYHGKSKALRDEGNGWEWLLDGGYSDVSDPTARTSQSAITRAVTGTLGDNIGTWRFGASYLSSDTPSENLTEDGPSVYLGHLWTGGQGRPSLDIKGTYSAYRYEVATQTASLTLRQTEARIGATLSWNLVSLYGGYGRYHYDQSVTRFAGALRNARVVRANLAAMRAAIYGFPSQTYEASVTVSASALWQWTVDETLSDTRAPKGVARTSSLTVSHEMDPFEIDVGAEHDQDPQFDQNLVLLNLIYRFNE